MYNVSEAYRKAIRQPGRALRSKFTLMDNNKVIDDNNIVTFTYTDDIIAKDDFEIGTAIMSTLTCELLYSTELEGIVFENKEIKLEVGIELEDKSFEYVPVGLYTIEKPEYSGKKISLKGVDRMYKFEKDYITNLTYPTTLLKIAQEVCQQAGVELVNANFPNSAYTINYKPVLEGVTLRKAISQIAELAGGYARINRSGKLEIFNLTIESGDIIKYTNNLDLFTMTDYFPISDEITERAATLTKDNYINLSNKELELAKINKVVVKLGSEEASKGTGSNPYYIVNNIFCQNPNLVIDQLFRVLNGIGYLPFEARWQGDPALDCGDFINVETEKDMLPSIFTNRTLTYKGGLREEVKAVGKSVTERNSTGKGSLTLDMERAFTEIKVLDGEITERVKQGDFDSYKTQTAQEISSKVSNKDFSSYQQQTATEISSKVGNSEFLTYKQQTATELTSKVSRGNDLKTEVTQNAESWTLSVGGKLNGAKYKFDGNGFTIGGTSGDIATHTPSLSKYTHSDGSYTQISSAGLERFVAGQPKKYHYLTYSGEVVGVNTSSTTITLPSDFKGKQFVVSVMISGLSPAGDVISGFFAYPASYDYANGKCTINLSVYSYSYYLSSYTVGSTVYYSLQLNPYSAGTFSIAYIAIA